MHRFKEPPDKINKGGQNTLLNEQVPWGDRASTPAGGNQIGSSWSSWGPVRSILTLSTGYQRLQPRIITRSCPFHPAFGHNRPQRTTHPHRAEERLLHESRLDLANVG
jgi:hypothetical protein